MVTNNTKPVTVYTRPLCGFCWAAKRILSDQSVAFDEVNCNDDPNACAEARKRTGHRTVPMIFVGDHFVGGCDELRQLVQADLFLPLLEQKPGGVTP